jgi:hypothetical protein
MRKLGSTCDGAEGSLLAGFVALSVALLAGFAVFTVFLIFKWVGYAVNIILIYFAWKNRNNLLKFFF